MDWADEARARLEKAASGAGNPLKFATPVLCDDIRAALGEIDKQSHLHDLDHKLANAMMERAEAAEAKLAEAERTLDATRSRLGDAINRLATEEAERIRCRNGWANAEAEAERLRERLDRATVVLDGWRHAPGMHGVLRVVDEALAALQGGGE